MINNYLDGNKKLDEKALRDIYGSARTDDYSDEKGRRKVACKAMTEDRMDRIGQGYVAGGNFLDEIMRWWHNEMPKTNHELVERVEEFFLECAAYNIAPSFEKLALSLGTHTTQLRAWAQSGTPETIDALQKAKDVMNAWESHSVELGTMPANLYMFRSKNYYDMKDEQTFSMSLPDVNPEVEADMISESILKRLPEAPDTPV